MKKIGGAVALASLLAPALAFAQLTAPTNPIPTSVVLGTTRITALINQVATFLIGIALIIAVIFIIWGGIMYMTAGADEGKATEAKARIKNGIIGAAIVLAVGLILSTLSSIIAAGSFQF